MTDIGQQLHNILRTCRLWHGLFWHRLLICKAKDVSGGKLCNALDQHGLPAWAALARKGPAALQL